MFVITAVLVFTAIFSTASAYTYSCAGAGCSIDQYGCSANQYTGQSGCGCSYLGNEVVCTEPASNSGVVNQGAPNARTGQPTSYTIENPLKTTSLCGLVENLLHAVIEIGIPIAVLTLVWIGFKFVMAQGNSIELEAQKKNLRYTILGIVIFLASWMIAVVIANTVNSLASGTGINPFVTSCN